MTARIRIIISDDSYYKVKSRLAYLSNGVPQRLMARDGDWDRYYLYVVMPGDVADVCHVYRATFAPGFESRLWTPPDAKLGDCVTLARKLSALLGLPRKGAVAGMERALLLSLRDDAEDLSRWSAYADWLMERDDPAENRRGLVIATWLSQDDRLKFKSGYPEITKDDYLR